MHAGATQRNGSHRYGRQRASRPRLGDAASAAAGVALVAYLLTFSAVRHWTLIASAACSGLVPLAFLLVWALTPRVADPR